MVAFKFDQILITSVGLMQGYSVMWLDEIILLACAKEGRYKTLLDVRDGRQLLDIKSSLLFNRLFDEGHSCTDQELRYFRMSRCQFIAKRP